LSAVPGALARLDAAPAGEAEARLLDCCGARSWARAMAARRPFATAEALRAAAEEELDRLTGADWEEALAAHPRIGAAADSGRQGTEGERWSAVEQAGIGAAAEATRRALAEGNRRYEARFGRGYVVRAAGRSAEELLAILERRLANDPVRELAEAADAQREITRLRIDRMLGA